MMSPALDQREITPVPNLPAHQAKAKREFWLTLLRSRLVYQLPSRSGTAAMSGLMSFTR